MSVVMSFIFMGFGLAICGAAATIYYKQERELKQSQPAATYLVAAQEAKKAPVSETPQKQNKVQLAKQEKPAKQAKVKRKRKSLYKALLGTKRRRPSGDKIYRQRINRLAGYMQRNLERGVDFYTLQEQMKAAGWREREILRAYYKIRK